VYSASKVFKKSHQKVYETHKRLFIPNKMKYLALFTSFLLSTRASPVKQRQSTQATISDFSASTNPNGNGATYAVHLLLPLYDFGNVMPMYVRPNANLNGSRRISYDISIPELLTTHCSYSDQTSGSKLPTVELTPCDDPSVRWQFRQDPSQPGTEGRYRIVVVILTPTSGSGEGGKAGFHEWVSTDFPLELVGSENETVYRGASEFAIDLS
jgi:hypothetical protein